MSDEWRTKCQKEWTGVPVPAGLDWKTVYESKPFGRNLLKNPAPHGVSHDTPPPEPELNDMPPDPDQPPRFQPDGDFTGWTTSVEVFAEDTSSIPPGVAVCHVGQYSWFTMEQRVDLKAEGLWDELLDSFQPAIVVKDWYEETQMHESIYSLKVQLLGADGKKVLATHSVDPTEELGEYSHTWKPVSHVFSRYGPGVRYVHFLHRLKNKFMVEFFPTLFTDSTVIVMPAKSA